jgi:hypothetical protein
VKILQSILCNKYFIILVISFILFISKWYPFIFGQENITINFLFNYDGDGKYWIPYIKFISDLTLNNSFDPNIENLRILPIPIGSLFLYSFFFKILGLNGLILIELFVIFLFLLIFFKIFNQITNEINSLILAIIMISFPEMVNFINIDNFNIINLVDNFFSYRPHRPIFSNIFFYFGIYFLLKILVEKNFNKKNLYIFFLFLGLLFSSFYYFFLILSITFLFIVKYRFGIINFIRTEYYTLVKSLLFFLVTSIPFIIVLLSHEKDVSSSAGLISLSYNQKIHLLKYYFGIYSNFKFIMIFCIITFLTFVFNKKNKTNKLILLAYIIFLSSLLCPLIFFLLSPSSGLVYHFNNNIILTIFLFFIFFTSCKIFNKINIKKLYLSIILIFILSFNIFVKIKLNFETHKAIKSNELIKEFSVITKNIKNDFNSEIENISVLTFDPNFMIWGILNKVKYFNILNHMWVPKNYNTMEVDLINSLKFLNIDEDGFKVFFKNNFDKWRYFNADVGELFGYRYQANSLVTEKNIDFNNDVMKKFIMKSSPRFNQQIAIPSSELNRLTSLFKEVRDYNFEKPTIIIINNNKDFLVNYFVDQDHYCSKFKKFYYSVYYLKESTKC